MQISKTTLRRLRERRGWLQSDLAVSAGLSKPYISQIESGERDPSPPAVMAIAKALSVDIEQLIPTEVTCPYCYCVFSAP
jgi:transcriptional regulator with XRE-family HTH domain